MHFFDTHPYWNVNPIQACFNSLAYFKTNTEEIILKLKDIAKINFSVYFDTHQHSRIKKVLKVEEYPAEKRTELIKILDSWCSFAKAKASQSALLLPNLVYDNLPFPFYSRRSEIFESSLNICKQIRYALANPIRGKVFDEKVFTCSLEQSDSEDNIQAIAITAEIKKTETPHLLIVYLASQPQNLVSPLNKLHPNCVAGAASSLIKHLAEEVCPRANLDRIELFGGSSSKDFYKKLGFIEKDYKMILDLKS